jgi:transcriptional regulator with XRE-family HTH domain
MKQKEHPLKQYMMTRGWNQAELARYLGVSETMISYVFLGKKSFGKRQALRISSLTKIPLLVLLYGKLHD